MSVAARLLAFAAVLALAFGAAALAGAGIDPTDERPAGADHNAGHAVDSDDHAEMEAGAHGPEMGSGALSGLSVTEGGYSLEVDRSRFAARRSTPFRFRVTDAHGDVVRDEFEVEHARRLHLIVVRQDTAVFEHVHPQQQPDGDWTVDLNLREPGAYRVFADFVIDGDKHALATDLFVAGRFVPEALPASEAVDSVDGLDVELETHDLRAGAEADLSFSVSRGGVPFEALDPYLDAKGHLVALREGDLGYLHVHPLDVARPDEIRFAATFPTAGRYRLFLQFKTAGTVRTVDYTLEVPR